MDLDTAVGVGLIYPADKETLTMLYLERDSGWVIIPPATLLYSVLRDY